MTPCGLQLAPRKGPGRFSAIVTGGLTSGLAEFQSPLSPRSHLYVPSGFANFLTSFLVAATVGTLVSCVSTFGEELGWRGYMLTRLIAAGVPKPVLVSGIIWALWHVPIIVSGQYAAGLRPRLSATLFVVGVIAEAYLIAFLRLRSGSIRPAVLMHGAWNAIIQGACDRRNVADRWRVWLVDSDGYHRFCIDRYRRWLELVSGSREATNPALWRACHYVDSLTAPAIIRRQPADDVT